MGTAELTEQAEPVQLTERQARVLTDSIVTSLEGLWGKIQQAYKHRAWVALGYDSWAAYCQTEFDSDRLCVPKAERKGVVRMLADAGMSTRAIAETTNTSKGTVGRELSDAPIGAPGTTGTDGKTYPRQPRKPALKVVPDPEPQPEIERMASIGEPELTEDEKRMFRRDYRSLQNTLAYYLSTKYAKSEFKELAAMLRDFADRMDG